MIEMMFYWGVWLTIPIMLEGLVSLGFLLRITYYCYREKSRCRAISPLKWPMVSVLVPSYNSQKTLASCLKSIINQDYLGFGQIELIVLNNGTTDNSFEVFKTVQHEKQATPNLCFYWCNMPIAGKAKALNVGTYQAKGEIIVTVDSDTVMERTAVTRLVSKYLKEGRGVAAVGGSVLIDYKQINPKLGWTRLLQLSEMYEYLEAFFVGRVAASVNNTVYTLAGAFSSFRKDKLNKTWHYHHNSLAEDTFLTFEVKQFGKVIFEPNAMVFAEPVQSLKKLTLQRFRWQRGQMEIAFRYKDQHIGSLTNLVNNHVMRTIFMDHTLMFSRTIWFFLMILLYFWGYPIKLFIGANLLMYLLYLVIDLSYLIPILILLTSREYKKFLGKNIYVILFMPIYRFIVFFIRLQGIIDGIIKTPKWNSKTLNEEMLEAYRGSRLQAREKWNYIKLIMKL